MDIDEIIDKIHPLPPRSKALLKQLISEVSHPKGYRLLSAGKVESNVYFVKRGVVRAYVDTADKEVTFWFGLEGDTVVSMQSYIAGQKGYESIELLEDCTLFELEAARLQELFTRDIHIANWGRKFAEQELVKTEKRLISLQFGTAAERYEQLLKEAPDMLQRIPLGHIASYLGITQVSLSRIRSKVK